MTSSASLEARIRPWDWVLSTASGFLLYAAHPPVSFGVLAWIALVPLLVALRGGSAGRRFALGLVCGTIFSWMLVGRWLADAAERGLSLSPIASASLALAAAEAFGGLYVAVFGLLCGTYRRGGAFAAVATAALWVGLELIRARAPGAIPWALLGHSQWAFPHVIQIADLGGVHAVSFVVAIVNAALVQVVSAPGRARAVAIAGASLVLTLAYGSGRLAAAPSGDRSIDVQIVYSAWDPGREAPRELFQRLLDLSETTPAGEARLIVWPENSVRFYLQQVPDAVAELRGLASRRGRFVLAGGPRFAGDRFYNSAYLFSPTGETATRDKRLLVPLAESRLPVLPSVERPFRPGAPWQPLDVEGLGVGVLICFEAIFPEPSRQLTQRGARLLVNLTNDHLVGAGAAQQAAMAVFRAVENRVPLLRVANLGPSFSVDSSGRIVDQAPAGDGSAIWSVAIRSDASPTAYARWGDWFGIACLVGACAGLMLRRT